MSIQHIKNIQHLKSLFFRPEVFVKKVWNKLNKLRAEYVIDGPTRRFIEHNRKVWKGWVDPQAKGVVLVSWDQIPQTNVLMMYFANVLARKKAARIFTFAFQAWPFARALHTINRSFNVTGHIQMGRLNETQQARAKQLYDESTKILKTKEDVFNLKIHGIHLGADIYESYLREFSKPTVIIDEALLTVLRQAIDCLVFWEDYFGRNNVVGVVISHTNYVHYNIICKVAYKNSVGVYTPLWSSFGFLKQTYDTYGFFPSYRAWFADLSEQEQRQAKELAKKQLEKRFNGEVGGDLYYMMDSAFRPKPDTPKILRASDKLKVLICTHCFYDSPHSYGGMIFIDFYEWLKFLVKTAEKTDYDWYLKTHPNPRPGTLEIINEILGSSSRITILPSSTSHQQLIQEGIDRVLTVYGTVGHEYPVSDVQVINAGYNPHVAYDFTWTPKNFKEYESFILNLKDLKKNIKLEEIYEFYYMHYYYRNSEDLVYHSFRNLYSQLKNDQRSNSDLYSYFLDGFSEQRHQESIRRLEDFIDSGKQYLFAKGPVDKQVANLSQDALCR